MIIGGQTTTRGQGKCGLTGKVMFGSQEHAFQRGGEILAGDPHAVSFRAYRCEFCGKFHLTTK